MVEISLKKLFEIIVNRVEYSLLKIDVSFSLFINVLFFSIYNLNLVLILQVQENLRYPQLGLRVPQDLV